VTLLIAIGGIAVLVVLLVLLVLSRIKVAGPNQAFLVTGRQGRSVTGADGSISRDMSGQKVVMGASIFVLPVVQKLHTLDLSSRRIPVGIRGAVSKQGVKCDLEGVAIVKVGGNESSIRAAAQRFLQQQAGIDTFTSEVLAGALRSIVGRLTIEEIIRDRAAFASAVAEEAESSLTGQGLVLDTFQLQDIQAEGTYLADLGRPEAARVLKEASIAEARARQAAQQEQLLADEAIAVSQRQLALKQAEIAAETDAAKARAAAAGPLAQAAQDQQVLAEQEKVAARTATLTQAQLDTQVRRPADAERYRVEQEAEGRKNSKILTAEADRQATIAAAQAAAEQAKLAGEGGGPAGRRWPTPRRSRAPSAGRPRSCAVRRSPTPSSARVSPRPPRSSPRARPRRSRWTPARRPSAPTARPRSWTCWSRCCPRSSPPRPPRCPAWTR
ncbi:Flotillin family protein, partial [Klenkia terrae]